MNKAREFLEEHLRTILIALIAIIIIVLATVIFSVAVGGGSERILSVSEVAGGVSVIKGDGQIAASRNMYIDSGDVIVTNSEGTVKLKTDNGKYIYVEPSSTVYVDYTEKKEQGSIIVNVSDGSVLCRLDNKLKKNSVFEVRTPNSIISAKGTVFHVDFTYYDNYNGYDGVMITRVNSVESMLTLQLYNVNGEKSGDPQLLGEGLGAELMSCAGFNGYNFLNESVGLTEFSPSTLRTLIRISGERDIPLELAELNDAFNAVYGRTDTVSEPVITIPTSSESLSGTSAPFGSLPENSETDRSVITTAPVQDETVINSDTVGGITTAPGVTTSGTVTDPPPTTSAVTQRTVTAAPVTTTTAAASTVPPVTTTAAPRITTAAPRTTTTAPKTVYVPPVTTAAPAATPVPETIPASETSVTAETTTASETTTVSLNWWEIINSNNTNYSGDTENDGADTE